MRESVCLWHMITDTVPFPEFWASVCIVLCQRLSGWVHFPLPPAPSPPQPASDVHRTTEDQIKSTQLSVSAIRGLWPCHSWRQACKPNHAGSDGSPLIPPDKLEWVLVDKQAGLQMLSWSWVCLRHAQAFNGFIYRSHLFTSLGSAVCPGCLCVCSATQIEFQHFSFSSRNHLNVSSQNMTLITEQCSRVK